MRRSFTRPAIAVLVAAAGLALYARPTADVAPPSSPVVAARPVIAPTETRLRRGETPERALVRHGLDRGDAAAIARALRTAGGLDVRRLRAGERVVVNWEAPGRPASIAYWRSAFDRYEVRRDGEEWRGRHVVTPATVRVVVVQGELQDSLFASMERLGESPGLTAKLVSLFEWDLDFAADSLPGDRFRLLVEKRYAGDHFVGDGDVLIAQYQTAGRAALTGVSYRDESGRLAYYDAGGRSVKKMFLRAPLDFTRITSGFSHARRHPILGGLRPHLAIDYGAPAGTPVRAVGDGVVLAAGRAGGYGLSVTLSHPRGYATMYNHLSRVDVRPGAMVRQRQIIGRVGSTGLSTGPHLDYRVMKNGRFVDPLGEKFIPGAPIPSEQRAQFEAHVRRLLERLDREAGAPADPPGHG